MVGKVGKLEYVEEDRVELVVNDRGKNEQVKNAIHELKSVSFTVMWGRKVFGVDISAGTSL